MIKTANSVLSCESILNFKELDYVLAPEVRACRQPVLNRLTCQSILCELQISDPSLGAC